MATFSMPSGRGDFLLHRRADERVGVRWERDRLDGAGPQPVDLSRDHAVFEMRRVGGEVLWSCACATTTDGVAWAEIPAGTLEGDAFDSCRSGEWEIRCEHDGRAELLGCGYWEVV